MARVSNHKLMSHRLAEQQVAVGNSAQSIRRSG